MPAVLSVKTLGCGCNSTGLCLKLFKISTERRLTPFHVLMPGFIHAFTCVISSSANTTNVKLGPGIENIVATCKLNKINDKLGISSHKDININRIRLFFTQGYKYQSYQAFLHKRNQLIPVVFKILPEIVLRVMYKLDQNWFGLLPYKCHSHRCQRSSCHTLSHQSLSSLRSLPLQHVHKTADIEVYLGSGIILTINYNRYIEVDW